MDRLRRWLGTATAVSAITFIFPALSAGATFDFSATIRAGMQNNGDWELGIGPLGNNTAFNAEVNNPNYYPNGLPNRFEIGYTNATNTAFVRYYYSATAYQQVTYAPGGLGLGANATWTIPVGSLYVSASSRPAATGITIDQLSLQGGVQVLQPLSSTTLYASQPGGSSSLMSMGNQVVFRTGTTGDWLLSGRIAFSGLLAYVGGGASRSQLQMISSFMGSSYAIPEPLTTASVGLGLTCLALVRFRLRRSGGSKQ